MSFLVFRRVLVGARMDQEEGEKEKERKRCSNRQHLGEQAHACARYLHPPPYVMECTATETGQAGISKEGGGNNGSAGMRSAFEMTVKEGTERQSLRSQTKEQA